MRSAPFRNRFGAATTLSALLLAWGGLSFLWTPRPGAATPYYLGYLVQVLITYVLCKLYPARDVFRNACLGTAYASAVSTPIAIVLVGFEGGRLGGVDHSSMVTAISIAACLGVISVLYLVSDKDMSKSMAALLLSSMLAALFLTFAKTTSISLVAAGIVYALIAPGSLGQRIARIALLATGLTLALLVAASKIADYMNRAAASGADTLTGRTILWVQTYSQIVYGPFMRGNGLLAFREIGPVPFHDVQRLVHAHNDFLTVWFNFGMVGVVLAFGAYFALAFRSLQAMRRGGGAIAALTLCVIVFWLADGIASASQVMTDFPVQWLLLFDCLVSTYLAGALRGAAPKRSSIRGV
ncbi:MAG: O-antigen ligase family protein [Terracidiphilus sp.]